MLNKSFLTNFVSLLLIAAGFLTDGELANILYNTGVFAFSGAITNWLAIYMLFEKVPGLYGSGVIPARFEDFKRGIHALLMEQFFTKANVERFFSAADGKHRDSFDITPIIESVDFNPAFEGLVQVIMTSSFGGMLAMFGGEPALQPLRIPFCEKMKISLEEISKTETFQQNLQANISQSSEIGRAHV